MQHYRKLSTTAALVLACLTISAQEAARPKASEARGLPPRSSPAEYQSAAKLGPLTIAADFAGHGVPTADGVFSTEDYVVVEVAFFGPPGSHLNLSYKDFSLRLNGKKSASSAQPYEGAFGSLKDPEWIPPPTEAKSKTSLGGGGSGDPPPAPPKMPMNLRLAMEAKVQKAAIPEGERPLPEAGVLFFQHGGKLSGIHSLELVYSGAAGKAKLPLQ